MSYQLISSSGNIEAVIDDNCGMTKFLKIANTLAEECRVKFTLKEDNSDTVDWFFSYKRCNLRLHYNIYNGVSICNCDRKSGAAVTELASLLELNFY